MKGEFVMLDKNVGAQVDKILKQEQKIQNFYSRYTSKFLKLGVPLIEAVKNGSIDFEELKELKHQENELYEYFYDDPLLFSDVLKRIHTNEKGISQVIPSYHKVDIHSLSSSTLLQRLKTQLSDYDIVCGDSIVQQQYFDPIQVDSYHFAHFILQDPEFVHLAVKEEFLRIFLIHLHRSVDVNIQLQNLDTAYSIMQLENHILMENSAIEADFIENFFPYDSPFYLDAVESLIEDGANPNASLYVNEEFVKEQAIDAMSVIMNSSEMDLNYALHSLYLYSAIIQSRDESTLSYLQNFFLEKYGNHLDSISNDNLATVLNGFQSLDKLKAGFAYVKK